MGGRAQGDLGAERMLHRLAMRARGPASAAGVGIGAVGRMRPLSPRVVVESAAEATLVLLVVRTAIGIGTVTVMEGDLGMRGIDDHRCLGENRRLREHRGVSGIVHRGTDGQCLGLGLGLGLDRVPHQQRGGGGELDGLRFCHVL